MCKCKSLTYTRRATRANEDNERKKGLNKNDEANHTKMKRAREEEEIEANIAGFYDVKWIKVKWLTLFFHVHFLLHGHIDEGREESDRTR